MNHKAHVETGLAMCVTMVPVAGVSKGIVPGLMSAYAGVGDDATTGALARAVREYPLPHKRLLAYAARNPPPQTWYEKDEDLF